MLLVVLFHQRRQIHLLAAGAFCFGLGFWDKALFAWLFSGLAIAAMLVFPGAIRRSLTLKNAAAFALGFLLGAAPLIAYNVANSFPTFHAPSGFTTHEIYPKKLAILGATAEGAVLLGYLNNQDYAPMPRQPRNALEQFSFWLRHLTGPRRRNGLIWALIVALLGLPFLYRTSALKTAIFCLIAMSVAWFQIAITKEVGSAHHVVLLWPLPMLLLGAVFAQAAARWGRIGRVAVLLGIGWLLVVNLLLTNQYLYQFARNGSPGSWTDAIYPLAAGLPRADASRIALIDWGMSLPLDVLDRGRLPLVWAADPFLPQPQGKEPPAPDPNLLKDPRVLWLGHTGRQRAVRGVNAGVDRFAQKEGYAKTLQLCRSIATATAGQPFKPSGSASNPALWSRALSPAPL